MQKLLAAVSVLALFLGTVGPAQASESAGALMARKALRGFENATLGFVTEWPKTIYADGVDRGILYGITVGALRGVGVGALRTGIGIYEIATFPVPLPASYKPMLYPEFTHELGEETRTP